MTKEKQFSFLSKDGKTKIHAVKWMPESGEYRAVLQITHGMVEYIERYKPFAEFLNDQGVLVVGHDHLGHGASVASEEELGYFAEPDPSDTLVEDMHDDPDREPRRAVFYDGTQHGILHAAQIPVYSPGGSGWRRHHGNRGNAG